LESRNFKRTSLWQPRLPPGATIALAAAEVKRRRRARPVVGRRGSSVDNPPPRPRDRRPALAPKHAILALPPDDRVERGRLDRPSDTSRNSHTPEASAAATWYGYCVRRGHSGVAHAHSRRQRHRVQALDHWAYWNMVELDFSQPAKPVDTPSSKPSTARFDASAYRYIGFSGSRIWSARSRRGATTTATVVRTTVWWTSRRPSFGPAYAVPRTAVSSKFHRP